MGTNPLTYRLYRGQSCDGRGTPRRVGRTGDRSTAALFLKSIALSPYLFGHVVVDMSDTEEKFYSKEADLP